MDDTDKSLYHGIFNWSGEVHELYSHAVSPSQAFHFMITKLAKELHQTRYSVLVRFTNQTDNYKIEKE